MIIQNCRVFYAKLIPSRPYDRFDKDNPRWECQLRTNDPKQKKLWDENSLHPKLMIHKDGEEEGEPLLDDEGKKQWRVNLKKRATKKNGDEAPPVEVVNAAKQPIDPSSLGNGSICNIRVYQYTYPDKVTKEPKVANVLMGLQVLHHIVYEHSFEEFDDEGETEVTTPSDNEPNTPVVIGDGSKDDDGDSEESEKKAPSPKPAKADL